MKSYYYNDKAEGDGRYPHQFEPNQEVTQEQLDKLGVLHWSLKPETWEEEVEAICKQREYKNRDQVIISPDKLPSYEEKIQIFFTEHLHEDEEIRLIMEGSGYFDIRDAEDRWIRLHLTPLDMIVLPAGSYHRFTPDTNNFTKAMRLFKDVPVWTPINRPADDNQYRQEYLKAISSN